MRKLFSKRFLLISSNNFEIIYFNFQIISLKSSNEFRSAKGVIQNFIENLKILKMIKNFAIVVIVRVIADSNANLKILENIFLTQKFQIFKPIVMYELSRPGVSPSILVVFVTETPHKEPCINFLIFFYIFVRSIFPFSRVLRIDWYQNFQKIR